MTTKSSRRSWLKLLISALIPLMIGIFTVLSTFQQQKLSTLQREQDKKDALLLRQQTEHHADNLHKDNVYDTYLDAVSKLLKGKDEKKSLMQIRAKTLTSLRRLNSERRKQLLLYLYDSELISYPPQKNLSSVLKLSDGDFNGIYFEGTIETTCSFLYLYLYHVYLSNASFINCYIDSSNFSSSTMYKTDFFKAQFFRTSFRAALLDKSNFIQAKFFQINFFGASLAKCNFTGANWTNQTVDFTSANLSGAILSDRQLTRSILYNSMLPNGTWGPIQNQNLVVNGDAEQDNLTTSSTNITGWYVSAPEKISSIAYNNQNSTKEFGKYYFRVTPDYNLSVAVSMSQNISLEKFILLISAGNARYNASVNFQCSGNQVGYMELVFADLNGLQYFPIYRWTKTKMQMERLVISNVAHFEVRRAQLKIIFRRDVSYNETNTPVEQNYCIADNIQFSIMKDK